MTNCSCLAVAVGALTLFVAVWAGRPPPSDLWFGSRWFIGNKVSPLLACHTHSNTNHSRSHHRNGVVAALLVSAHDAVKRGPDNAWCPRPLRDSLPLLGDLGPRFDLLPCNIVGEPVVIQGATLSDVWRLVADFDSYWRWNPFTPGVDVQHPQAQQQQQQQQQQQPAQQHLPIGTPVLLRVSWSGAACPAVQSCDGAAASDAAPRPPLAYHMDVTEHVTVWQPPPPSPQEATTDAPFAAVAWGLRIPLLLSTERLTLVQELPPPQQGSNSSPRVALVSYDRMCGILSPLVYWLFGDAIQVGLSNMAASLKLTVEAQLQAMPPPCAPCSDQ